MLSCGNKVSPASLLSNTTSESSMDPGLNNCIESQHSQMSLFSSSDVPSSLELFSQPPHHSFENTTAHATTSTIAHGTTGLGDTSKVSHPEAVPQALGGKKYYMRYLRVNGEAPKHSGVVESRSRDCDPKVGKRSFEAWKDNQQDQLERKQIISDYTGIVKETAAELRGSIDQLKEEMKDSIAEIRVQIDTVSSHCGEQAMSFYTRLLHGQEEIKQVIQDIRKEISQQRSMLDCLTSQLSSVRTANVDLTRTLTTQQENIIESVTTALQRVAVPVISVSTQTPSPTVIKACPVQDENHPSRANDQAVPRTESTVTVDCGLRRNFYDAGDENSLKAGSQYSLSTESPPSPCLDSLSLSTVNDKNSQTNHKRKYPSKNDLKQPPLSDKLLQSHKELNTSSKLAGDNSRTIGKKTSVKRSRTEQTSPLPKKLHHKPESRGKKVPKVKPEFKSRRQSNRTKKPAICDVDSDDLSIAQEGRNKIRRKVLVRQPEKVCSHENSFIESPVNALNDTFYSEVSSQKDVPPKNVSKKAVDTVYSEVSSQKDIPPKNVGTNAVMEKFHRSNEAAKRRLKVISNLTDSSLILREIKESIRNNLVDTSDPSP